MFVDLSTDNLGSVLVFTCLVGGARFILPPVVWVLLLRDWLELFIWSPSFARVSRRT